MDELKEASLHTALFALLYEAKRLGYDVEKLCEVTRQGLLDGAKPYRGGSANQVVPASEAIEKALENANESSK